MVRSLTHPRMLEKLGNHFPGTCTIQQATETRDAHGQPIPAWANLAGHVNIPCLVATTGGDEVQTGMETYAVSTHAISLKGLYPAITAKMRAVVSGVNYDILLPNQSGIGLHTVLVCRVVA